MSRKMINLFALASLSIIILSAGIQRAVAVTWSINITRWTTEFVFDGLPSITQTDDARIWIVWAKAVLGDNTLFCKTSSDLGATWSGEKNLTYIPSPVVARHDTSPSITQAANGTIWLFWASNKPPPLGPDFSIAASPDNLTIPQGDSDNSKIIVTSLRNFNDPVDLSVKNPILGVNTSLDPTQVTPPPNGTANSTLTISVEATAIPGNYTLTVNGRSGELAHSVQIALEIAGSGTASPSRASSSSSPPVAEDGMDYEIYYKTSNDDGATWSARHQLTNNTKDDLKPSVVHLKNGTIMVVLQTEKAGNNPEIVYNATSDGVSWTHGRITSDSAWDKAPSVMQAEDEKIWVAWASDRTGDNEIYYKTHDGVSWSNATRVTNSTKIDISPSICQTIDGTIWIFWTSTGTGTQATGDIYYKFSTDNGVSWSDRVQFTTDKYEDTWSAVTQTHDTKIWVVWTSDRADRPDGNWDIYYRTSLAGDVNEDGAVDIYDLNQAGHAFGAVVGEPEYDLDADINKDDRVDMRDLAIVCRYYGAT